MFTGWRGASFYPEASYEQNAREACTKAINWDALLRHASSLRRGMGCHVAPESTMGGCHLIHLLRFEDDTQWIVRFPLDTPTPALARQLQSEADTMTLIRSRTKIPVPKVLGFDTGSETSVGVPFIMMEFIPGTVAMDVDGGWETHFGEIAAHHKPGFYRSMASIQVEMASVRMPKIGSVFMNSDGTYDVGPLPDLGGPFDTATAFFKAWAARAKFPYSEKTIRKSMGDGPVEAVLSSISKFPGQVEALAGCLSSQDEGPFPIYHPDLFHSNVIVDDQFNVLSVIDWQGACTVPWELVETPLFLTTVPRAMDAPFNYDHHGQPKDEDLQLRWKERSEYFQMVRAAEAAKNQDAALSKTLVDTEIQGLAFAIKVYVDPGKLGFYDKILEPFAEKHAGRLWA